MKAKYQKTKELIILEGLYHEWKLRLPQYQNPQLNKAYVPKTKFRDDSTNELTKCVEAYCQILEGIFVERVANAGKYSKKSNRFIKGTGTNGTADLHAIIHGRSVKIEIKCKATNDRQSEAQKRYQQKVEQAGATYLIVRTFKEFFDFINRIK